MSTECQVCGRNRPTHVAASPFAPMSFAYCSECISKPAETLVIFNYLYDEVAQGDPTNLDQSIRNWYTWIDDKYIHWDNYVWRRKNEK